MQVEDVKLSTKANNTGWAHIAGRWHWMLYIQKILLINFINISTKFKIIQKITNIFIIKNFNVKNKS